MAEVTGETVNQENTAKQPERTFTQTEVNAIIGDRLERERAKYADYDSIKAKAAKFDEAEEASKSELQKATELAKSLQDEVNKLKSVNAVREIRDKVAKETGVPVSCLSGDTEEACKEQADEILKFARPNAYPEVKDGGEISVSKHGKASTNEQFAEWLYYTAFSPHSIAK